jgi:chemotaxis-related protein WspB
VLIARYRPNHGEERLLALIAERATEMLSRAPDDFRDAGLHTGAARYLGAVTRDERGLIQRIDLAALLDEPLRAALFPAAQTAASDEGSEARP